MSFIETIRRIQQERDADVERREALRRKSEEEAKSNREAEERKRQLLVQQAEKILKLSGALEGLQRINKEVFNDLNDLNHGIHYFPEDKRVTLAWGVGFKEALKGKYRSYRDSDHDYARIDIEVDPDKEILTIRGSYQYQFDRDNWRNTRAVEEALILAFSYPKYLELEPYHEPDTHTGGYD